MDRPTPHPPDPRPEGTRPWPTRWLAFDAGARSGADVVIDSLVLQGVRHVFGIPGAKVDGVFDVLVDRGPQLVVCRHEQNAAFMAGAVGRLTGRPGVCLVTSGPGASSLVTGLLTATTEGDPVVALVGSVPRSHALKRTHQSVDTAALFASFAKYSVEVEPPDNVGEAVARRSSRPCPNPWAPLSSRCLTT